MYGGGLLADEMGMGKTIQMIALMVSDTTRPNLVIACVPLLPPPTTGAGLALNSNYTSEIY